MAAGLSEALCSWMPVDSSSCVWEISVSSVCICWEALVWKPRVETRIALAVGDCGEETGEHLAGGLDHLRAGLVGLLILDHVGGFLIQIDAGHGVHGIGGRGIDGLLCLRIGLSLLSLRADLRHEGIGRSDQGGRAAIERIGLQSVDYGEQVRVVAGIARIAADRERVAR